MNGEEMKLEPLGCPFCGCAPAVSSYETGNEDDMAWVVACDCKLVPEDQPYAERYLSAHGQTREEAVRHWNARAPINRPSPEAGESGLVESLRKVSDRRSLTIGAIWTIAGEAADEITRLQAELAEAREGVTPKLRQMLDDAGNALNKTIAERIQAEAQRDAALVALRPFAEVAEHDVGEDEVDADRFRPMSPGRNKAPAIRVGHLRAARQALTSLSPAKDEEKGNG